MKLREIGRRKFSAAKAIPLATPSPGLEIPLTTVTYQSSPGSLGNFDSQIDILFDGAPANSSTELILDSGNSTLIVPRFEDLSGLAGYTVLVQNSTEPWGCPAHIVRGPIDLPTRSHGILRIPNCVFYACTDNNQQGERTSNFGLGYVYPWTSDPSGVTVQAPLSYLQQLPFVEVNILPAPATIDAAGGPSITEDSTLTLFGEPPQGYQMFDAVPNSPWMSLVPKSLSIGGVVTTWPGNLASPIAMIDTGGGPVFLSDPDDAVCAQAWPDMVASPDWTNPGSLPCESTAASLEIELGDGVNTYTFSIEEAFFTCHHIGDVQAV